MDRNCRKRKHERPIVKTFAGQACEQSWSRQMLTIAKRSRRRRHDDIARNDNDYSMTDLQSSDLQICKVVCYMFVEQRLGKRLPVNFLRHRGVDEDIRNRLW